LTGYAPTTTRLCSLAEDVLVEGEAGPGPLSVVTDWGEFVFDPVSEPVRESIRRMVLGPVALDNVPAAGLAERAELDAVLAQLSGSVVHSIRTDDGQGALLSAVPTSARAPFDMRSPSPAQPVRLSRFALLRPRDGELSLESAQARFRVVLHQPLAVQAAAALAEAVTVEDLSASLDVPSTVISDIVGFLTAAGVVLVGDGAARFGEDSDPALRPWDHHELLFHRLSRSRFTSAATLDATMPSPAVKPSPPGERFPLSRPTVPELLDRDAPLTALLESDYTCPDFTTRELSFEQLGELLYRSARVRGPGPAHLPHGMTHEASQRPYLSIAGLYELELYLSLERCAGLPRAVFHYDPAEHALTLVNSDDAERSALLDTAMIAACCVRRPAALITIAARMDRTAVLGGAAYATTLMHVGALQQTLSLVAQSMGLEAHPIPADGYDTVDRTIGLRWPAEVVVGQCVLNSPL
jgi:SagB-type dehydrogenase family enzyme